MEILKRNINKRIKSDNETARKISIALRKSPNIPVRETIQKIIDLHLTTARYHRTTLLLVENIEKKVDNTPIVTRRKEIMGEIMELMETLVADGAMKEKEYLEKCKEFKEDVEMLEDEIE